MMDVDDRVLEIFPRELCVEFAVIPKSRTPQGVVFFCKETPSNEAASQIGWLIRIKNVEFELIDQDDHGRFDQTIHRWNREAYSPIHDKKDGKCPRCASPKVRNIEYGLPGDLLLKKAEAGEVVLGGCMFTCYSPRRACLGCKYEWNWEEDVS